MLRDFKSYFCFFQLALEEQCCLQICDFCSQVLLIHCICSCGLTWNSGGDTVSKIGVEKRNEVLWKQKGNLSFDLTSELTEVIPVNSKTEMVVALYNPVKILGSLGVSYNENE